MRPISSIWAASMSEGAPASRPSSTARTEPMVSVATSSATSASLSRTRDAAGSSKPVGEGVSPGGVRRFRCGVVGSMVHDTALAPNSSSIFMRASWALALVPARASLSNSNSPRSLS